MAEQHSTRRKAGCSGGQSPDFRNQLVLQLRDGLQAIPRICRLVRPAAVPGAPVVSQLLNCWEPR